MKIGDKAFAIRWIAPPKDKQWYNPHATYGFSKTPKLLNTKEEAVSTAQFTRDYYTERYNDFVVSGKAKNDPHWTTMYEWTREVEIITIELKETEREVL